MPESVFFEDVCLGFEGRLRQNGDEVLSGSGKQKLRQPAARRKSKQDGETIV